MANFRSYTNKYDIEIHIWKEKISTMHWHDYYEFAVCNKGEIIHNLNDNKPVKLKKGQAFLITPKDRHSISALKGATHINIAFIPKIYLELCRYFRIKDGQDVLPSQITLTDIEFNEIESNINMLLQIDHNTCEEEYVNALYFIVAETFFFFLKRRKAADEQKGIPKWLQDFVNEVSNVKYFNASIKELYALSNYSQPVLTRDFKKYYGETFVEYFTKTKIIYASNLLKNTDLGILEISNMIGMSSLSHFNAVFKKITGDTPGKYRKTR